MLPKTLFVVAFVTLVIFACLNQSHQISHNHSPHDVSAMKTLQGYKKGDTREGIHNLRKYLHHYGYLQDGHLNNSNVDLNLFDEDVEFAVKTYQVNFNLNPTGVLDEATVSLMDMPRCGVADIIDGKTRMNAAAKSYNLSYVFFPGNPKWTKTRLTWAIRPGTRRDVIEPMRDFAMVTWESFVPQFEFIFQDENVKYADIKVGVGKIDGPWKILAWAEEPMGGNMEFDEEEDWTYGAVPNKLDMGSIGLHEMGHILGLAHSSDETATMWPIAKIGEINYPSYDDWLGIRTLYPT